MTIDQILDGIRTFLGNETWIVQVFFIVFFTLLIDFSQKRILAKIQKRVDKTSNTWDDALFFAVRRPIRLLIWVSGVTLAAEIVKLQTDAPIFSLLEPVRYIGLIAAIAWFLIRLVSGIENNFIKVQADDYDGLDRTTIDAIAKLCRISIVITTSLVGLQTLGVNIAGVLAFGGVGGLAVGLAAKDLLANFFGGFMVYLDRPFAVGDWIRSPDRNIEGVVEKIGWRQTTIRTFDKRPLYVPNSTFSVVAVENPSRMTHRRIYETLGLRYDDAAKMNVILKDIEAMLKSHPDIDQSQTLMVNFNSFSESALDFFVYTFTKTTVWTRFHQVKQDVLLQIETIISNHGAEFAFPTTTLHVPDVLQFSGLTDPTHSRSQT